MKWLDKLGLVTKKEHLKTIGRLMDEQIALEATLREQWYAEVQELNQLQLQTRLHYYQLLEETEKLVDTTLKELSRLAISRTPKPPFEWAIMLSVDSELVAKLRDPGLWFASQPPLKSKAPRFIIHRFTRMLEEQLEKHGLTETKDWK